MFGGVRTPSTSQTGSGRERLSDRPFVTTVSLVEEEFSEVGREKMGWDGVPKQTGVVWVGGGVGQRVEDPPTHSSDRTPGKIVVTV